VSLLVEIARPACFFPAVADLKRIFPTPGTAPPSGDKHRGRINDQRSGKFVREVSAYSTALPEGAPLAAYHSQRQTNCQSKEAFLKKPQRVR
jgi:hypothetical protein